MLKLIRVLPWLILYLLTLGAATIKVRWNDGVFFETKGWLK